MSDYINRQDAIEALTKANLKKHMDSVQDGGQINRSAIRIIMGLPTADVTKLKWIPHKDKRPTEKEEKYLVQTDTGYVCECRWTNVNHMWTGLTTNWHWHIFDIPQYSKVVAWMTLPKLYIEEDEE